MNPIAKITSYILNIVILGLAYATCESWWLGLWLFFVLAYSLIKIFKVELPWINEKEDD